MIAGLGKQGLFRLIGLASNVALARLLFPDTFGVYAILSSIVTTSAFFADFGLSGSLLQKREALNVRDLQTVFTAQLALYGGTALLIVALAPVVVAIYHLDESAAWLIRVFAIYLVLTPFRNLTATQLSRDLRFAWLAIPEVAEKFVNSAVAVWLAYLGYETWSLVWATLISVLVGTILTYRLAPWRVGLAWDRAILRGVSRFALPYQGLRTISTLRAFFGSAVVAALIGSTEFGYLAFVAPLVALPVLVANQAQTLMFPAFARVQDDRAESGRLYDGFMRVSSLTVYPIACLMIGMAPELVHFVYTDKWAPAVPALVLSLIGLWAYPFGSGAIYNLLLGHGKLGIAWTLMVVWATLDLLVIVPCVLVFGYLGAPIGYLLADVSLLLAIPSARKVCDFHILPNCLPGVAAGVLGIGAMRVVAPLVDGLPGLFTLASVGGSVIVAVLAIGWGRSLLGQLVLTWGYAQLRR